MYHPEKPHNFLAERDLPQSVPLITPSQREAFYAKSSSTEPDLTTRAGLLEYAKQEFSKALAIMEKKNHDYAGGSDDPFFNFTKVELLGIASTEQGFLTRIFDKIARITTFVSKGVLTVEDESVDDTLSDLMNYALLLKAYIRAKRQKAGK